MCQRSSGIVFHYKDKLFLSQPFCCLCELSILILSYPGHLVAASPRPWQQKLPLLQLQQHKDLWARGIAINLEEWHLSNFGQATNLLQHTFKGRRQRHRPVILVVDRESRQRTANAQHQDLLGEAAVHTKLQAVRQAETYRILALGDEADIMSHQTLEVHARHGPTAPWKLVRPWEFPLNTLEQRAPRTKDLRMAQVSKLSVPFKGTPGAPKGAYPMSAVWKPVRAPWLLD